MRLHLLPHILPRRGSLARDTSIPPRFGIDRMLLLCVFLVVTRCAAYATRLVEDLFLARTDGLFVALLFLLCLGHADEPVQREGGENVEDAVCPKDTWVDC
jgi:hypothetical protein